MSARKLSRFAGLVFVLAAVIGGAGAAAADAGHAAGESSTSTSAIGRPFQLLETVWD